MALKLIKKLLDKDGNEQIIKGNLVIDEATGKSFEDAVSEIAEIAELKKTLNNFLTGEADGGELDRLVELVKAISDNKDSIDALVSDKIAKADIVNALTSIDETKVLSAAQGKALKDLIDALDKKVADVIAESGSIAYVADEGDEASFDGKLIMVVTPYTPPASGETA